MAKQAEDPKMKILVAEDSATQAAEIAYILEEAGYEVAIATNGREALRLAEEIQPTLIISDIIMPKMNGYELCHSIKQRDSLKNTPVILLTALSDPVDVIHGLECCADNFIVKPYDQQYLLSRIQSILANLHLRDSQMGVEVNFSGNQYFITSSRIQILNLLMSSYETAVHKNRKLIETQNELRYLNEYLEECVQDRTVQLSSEIVERKRAEEEVRALNIDLEKRVTARTEQLQIANKELEAFSYSVSHDLRAPLRSIIGFNTLLINEYLQQLPEEGQKYLYFVNEAGAKMAQLIEDLLNLSRISRKELRHEPVDLSALAKKLLEEIRREEPQRQVDCQVAAGLQVGGDPNQLRIMLENLLRNAWKFTGKSAAPRIEVGMEKADGARVYFVRDNGAGFDMGAVDKLFGAFQRLHSADEFEGTGIGLAIVQRIVARHGGRIWAEGKLGGGAIFRFTLPGK